MIYFRNPSFDKAIIGVSTDIRVVYSYEKMVEQFMEEEQCSLEEAVDFIDYNTIRSLDYVKDAPIVVYEEYDIDYFEEEADMDMMEVKTLKDTVEEMCSDDYKQRFKAEVHQLKLRYDGLKKMLNKWDAGEIEFKPTCPRSVYDLQVKAMGDYLAVLEARARIENIVL